MLQPLQLQAVSARYPHQIAELRDFLLQAGAVTATEQSLQSIVHRLQRDRAFHRDLTSHLWVVIHSAHRTISYADLLGVLTIATAGPQFAAQAHEDDAHALLRFVLEARSALDGVPDQNPIPPSAPRPVSPVDSHAPAPRIIQPAIPREEEARTWQPRPTQFSALESEHHEESESSRKPLVWIAAACVLLALSIGLFLHLRSAPDQPAASTPEATPPTVAHETSPTPPESVAPETVAPEAAAPETKTAHLTSRTTRDRHTKRNLPTRPAYFPAAPQPPITASAPPAAPITRPTTTPPPPMPRPTAIATAPLKPAPTTTNPSEPDRTNISRTYQPPRLVRRTPEQRAELNPGTLNTTVHATTLGAGASSVLYSPVPAYPPAAASARVQGEVKVQANVDRQGNVSAVRVISGPPLLREAALDAAQRWRFRPNMEDGQPTSMSAITVFAFQLP